MPKTLQLSIPDEAVVPEIITTFSPEENYLMLKIGSDCLREGRNAVAGLTQKEIYAKIKEEASAHVHRLEMDIIVQKELTKQMEEKISKMYEGQLTKMEKQIELFSNQLKENQIGSQEMIEKVVRKERDKFNLLLQEKDRQNQLNREVFDKAEKLVNKNTSKSASYLGEYGENVFEQLSETFKDFLGYKIENKAKQGHKGDFHLFFDEFNVLVDSKNYSSAIRKKEVTKIESDLMVNDNMNYAWMVSLNTNISGYDRFSIDKKWITTDSGTKCILFINNLLSNKEPQNILRQAWSMCSDFHKLTKKVTKEDGELEKYREKDLLYKKQINTLQERVSEMRRHINGSSNVLKNMENDLLEILSIASDEIINNKFALNSKINEWWTMNIEYSEDENKLTSTEIWNKFKRDNKKDILKNNITIDEFKDIITNIVDSSTYEEKTKKGAIDFVGFKWREIVIENLIIKNIEKLELPKKVKKNKKTQYYFSKEKDKKILEDYEYEINNIMKISSDNNIKPWEVVSLLVRYKIIEKRDEARGYDIYKETDEYKQKCNT
jgi:hypothetical protein